MAETTTIARPYAKAIFNLALAEEKLGDWSTILDTLAQAVSNPAAQAFIGNPTTCAAEQQHVLLAAFSHTSFKQHVTQIENLIGVLAKNKRLLVAPAILAQYEQLRAEQEKTVTVDVSSFSKLSAQQRARLVESLSKRLQRKVTIEEHIDCSLLGGAIIRAGDLVIDGSVRGKLEKLGNAIVA